MSIASGTDSHPGIQIDRSHLRLLSEPTMTLFTAICAQIAIPTGELGIPLTLQTLAVLLTAMALGPKLGAASMILYIIAGAVGVGVFAEGESGWMTIIGQTGGYLVGFIACQPIAHMIIRRPDGSIRGWGALLLAGIAVHMVVFAFGVPYLWAIHKIDPETTTKTWGFVTYWGFVIFIPGMLIKTALAAVIGARYLPAVKRTIW